MKLFENPDWLNECMYDYDRFDQIPSGIFNDINRKLDRLQKGYPLVSVVIPARNEEVNILRTVASLSRAIVPYNIEIIIVNNDSTDRTQDTVDRLNVKSVFQSVAGWGPARQLGMEHAYGKYILMADADCYYPPKWIDEMIYALQKPDVACVYGRYSFIANEQMPRWKLSIYETLRDVIARVRDFKRPYLNAYGLSMGFVKEYALRVGFVMHKIRGEDGRMCFDLMRYGKVKPVLSKLSRIWTSPRTLQKDGKLSKAFWVRIAKEIKLLPQMLVRYPLHDTKTSSNDD